MQKIYQRRPGMSFFVVFCFALIVDNLSLICANVGELFFFDP